MIDEEGFLALDNRNADLLFQVVNRRYEKKSLVLTTRRLGDGSPAPRGPVFSQGATRVSQVPGLSSSCAPRAPSPECPPPTSPGVRPTALISGVFAVAFRRANALGTWDASFSMLNCRGPHARVPTHRRRRFLLRRKARYRLGKLPLGRTDSDPLDNILEFHELRIVIPSDQPFLVALAP
ncbi:ATP-binding protein [Pendulispora albinea]|uniref:ATP-binding protein n=1 Tax=Pendulispora albinea TaxID=2741071 RepID=UPI00374E1AF4